VEPVIAGIEKDGKVSSFFFSNESHVFNVDLQPYICAMDLIGAPLFTDDFVVSGTANEALYGLCESLYRPNLVRSIFTSQLQFSSHVIIRNPRTCLRQYHSVSFLLWEEMPFLVGVRWCT